MLDFNEVALFVEVVRAGSFAEAARRLGIPANTISRRVQSLEQHLGARLMQRSTRRLSLTDAGRAFYDRSSEQVKELAEAAQDLVAGSTQPSGNVRVAAPADFLDFFRMEWIQEFLAAHPKVRIELLLSDAMADLIADGIDVAFRGGRLPDSSLVARRLATSRLVLAAAPDYLARRGTPLTPQALTLHDCVVSVGTSVRATWSLVRADGNESPVQVDVTGRIAANTAQALIKAAVAGAGIALVPVAMATPHMESGRLVQVLPEWGLEGVGVSFVYPSRRQLPRAVSAFIEFAMDKMLAHGLVLVTS
jgi:DNA-binding transcriptional LysR family regulator